MPVSKKEVGECPVDAMMRVMDGRWKGTILWRLQDGPRRTSELKRSIPGITERMLIRHLQHNRIFHERVVLLSFVPDRRPRVPFAERHKVEEIAKRAGWQCFVCNRGPFHVIEVWVENETMVEILPPEFAAEYLAFTRPDKIAAAMAAAQPATSRQRPA